MYHKIKKSLLVLTVLFLVNNSLLSQTARLQVIHNAADIAASSVDIYLWNTATNSKVIKLDDFGFRAATPFVDVPAGVDLNVIIAAPTSTNETDGAIATIPVGSLTVGESYVVFANGVLDPTQYAANPDEVSTAFQLLVKPMAREEALSENVEFFVLHGATDAPAVDVIARDVATLVDNAPYTAITDYIEVPAASYILDVTPGSDNETIVASFQADLNGLAGGSAVVFASGFLTPSANQNGEAFGIFAALANGTVVEFPAYVPTARLQVIHNAADVAATFVDIYLMNDHHDQLLKLDDFAFRAATPFVNVPAGIDLSVIIAGPTSSGPTDQAIATIPIGQLADMEKYVVFANGVLDPTQYAANPDEVSTAFQLLVKPMAREEALSENVEFFVLHGATDAPAVDVIARSVATLVDNAAYTDMTDYIPVPAAKYTLDVTPAEDNETIVASFTADLIGLAGGSAVVFASGFLNPSANQDGAAFGIFAALANGTVVEFPAYVPTARLQVIHNAADIAAESVDIYLWNTISNSLVVKLDDFAFRTATPFVDVPAGQALDVIIAAPSSTSETDQVIATIPVGELADMEKYVVFANGVLDPSSYAANPDAISTAFELLVKPMAREEALSDNVEFFVLHGATDAPAVDVIARNVTTLVDNAAYTDITDYIEVPAASYVLDVTPGNDNETVVASFQADLSGLAGGSAVVFASGFLNPSSNNNGEAFGIYAALANGTVVEFQQTITDISFDNIEVVPETYLLNQNYPNPFNPSTKISFSIPNPEKVSLKIYNILGSEISTLINKELNAGNYEFDFNASNLASGTYIYKLNAGKFSQTRIMNLIK
ncbi:MAG: DUF4397 domain-containing protein [Melioribacteraceae bacterium]